MLIVLTPMMAMTTTSVEQFIVPCLGNGDIYEAISDEEITSRVRPGGGVFGTSDGWLITLLGHNSHA